MEAAEKIETSETLSKKFMAHLEALGAIAHESMYQIGGITYDIGSGVMLGAILTSITSGGEAVESIEHFNMFRMSIQEWFLAGTSLRKLGSVIMDLANE